MFHERTRHNEVNYYFVRENKGTHYSFLLHEDENQLRDIIKLSILAQGEMLKNYLGIR